MDGDDSKRAESKELTVQLLTMPILVLAAATAEAWLLEGSPSGWSPYTEAALVRKPVVVAAAVMRFGRR